MYNREVINKWKHPIKYFKFKRAYTALLKANAKHYKNQIAISEIRGGRAQLVNYVDLI